MRAIEQIDKVKIGHGTHEGMSGKHNEDSYGFFAWTLADGRDFTVGVVADGIGGQTAGELASSVAVEAVRTYFDRQADENMRSVSPHLERAILSANEAVVKTAQNNPQYKGMGTTMVLVADAVRHGAQPGDVTVFRPEDVVSHKIHGGISTHEGDILKLIDLAKQIDQPIPPIRILAIASP